jgi:hypothetical protein
MILAILPTPGKSFALPSKTKQFRPFRLLAIFNEKRCDTFNRHFESKKQRPHGLTAGALLSEAQALNLGTSKKADRPRDCGEVVFRRQV